MAHILIVEDDAPLSNGIVLTLQEADRQFTQCFDISSAETQLGKGKVDLIILDINLPDGSGLTLCRRIRVLSTVPILFLTANDTELDMVSGLETGGDDYITKPFSLAVLRARVNALLRRVSSPRTQTKIEIDTFSFDFECMCFYKNNTPVELSKTEQKLLYQLVQNKGQILTREKLSEHIWPDGSEYVNENALSVAVRRLRSKLEDDPSAPQYIQTIFGLGYTWVVKS